MREILFRGKRIDNGKWIEGSFVKYTDCDNDKVYLIFASNGNPNDINPETVGQFTGLTDKNGKKIFEGDIVELHDKNANIKWKAVIVFGNPYSNYSWGWELLYIGQNPKINTDILCWVEMEETGAYCEVIGNIYDNPELLKEQQNER